MIINASPEFKKIGKVVERLVAGSGRASEILSDATFSIGRASDPKYGIPAGAMMAPTYVGDSAMIGDLVGKTAQLDAAFKKDASSVNIKPVYNAITRKYDIKVSASGLTADGLLASQAISPWNASFFEEVYRQPLVYSHARDLVKRRGGTNPWGEVQNLAVAAYAGWAAIGSAGTVAANLKKNVNVQGGVMSSAIINIKVFFNLTTEEIERATDGNGSPFAGSLMAEKQKYAQYVLDMVTDYLTYYGNADTDTDGLFDVNGLTTWSGNTLAQIAADTSDTTKGSTMYAALAGAVSDFMANAKNKFDVVKIAMAPEAYNLLASTAYSAAYEGKSAMTIFEENFAAGMTKNGSKPKIEIFADPLLSTDVTGDGSDRLVITAPEIGAGADDDKQDILLLGVPLEKFVYPVYPNSYDQQHCTLRRYAGVFAPVAAAVKVYSGFGVSA